MKGAAAFIIALLLAGCTASIDRAFPPETRGAVAAMIGPLQVRGVSATPDLQTLYVSLCREDRCSVHEAGEGGSLRAVLDDPEWDYRWVAAEGDTLLAVRSRPGAEYRAAERYDIVRYRPGDRSVRVLRSEDQRITSLQALGGGAFAYFASTALKPVAGCATDCRYVPVAQRLVVVDGEGRTVGTMDGVVDGLSGEAFHPWAEDLWLVMPLDAARMRQLPATVTRGPYPELRVFAGMADLSAALPGGGWPDRFNGFNMIAQPFRPLDRVVTAEAVDLTGPGIAIVAQPVWGPDPDALTIDVMARSGDEWTRQSHTTFTLP